MQFPNISSEGLKAGITKSNVRSGPTSKKYFLQVIKIR